MDIATLGHALSVWLIPVVLAITIHEAAHGWMANRCGDPTARLLGRITINPIKHVHPVGTLLIPGLLLLVGAPFLFGFAKPVPVDFRNLRNPKRDMVWVALAGPGVNVIIAFLSALLLHLLVLLPAEMQPWVGQNLVNSITINIVLAIFNMLPIPPLDGGRVLTGLLPPPYDWKFAQVERFGLPLLLGLLFVVPFGANLVGLGFNPVASLILPAFYGLRGVILAAAGI